MNIKPLTPDRADEIASWLLRHREHLNEVPVGMVWTLQKWAEDERKKVDPAA